MQETSNYKKHQSKNPVQRYLIQNFFNAGASCLDNLGIKKVLDAGCGEGFFMSELNKRGIGEYFEGIDFSDDAIEMGRKMFPSLVLRKGDIYKLPFQENSFDLVVCTEVMEHLEFPEKVLDELERVSNQYCLLSVPNEPLFMTSNFLRGKNLSRWGNDEEHIQHWSCKKFVSLVKNKMDILEVKKPFPWSVILAKKRI